MRRKWCLSSGSGYYFPGGWWGCWSCPKYIGLSCFILCEMSMSLPLPPFSPPCWVVSFSSYWCVGPAKIFWILNLVLCVAELVMCGMSPRFPYCLVWWIEVFSIHVVTYIIPSLYGFAFKKILFNQFFLPWGHKHIVLDIPLKLVKSCLSHWSP